MAVHRFKYCRQRDLRRRDTGSDRQFRSHLYMYLIPKARIQYMLEQCRTSFHQNGMYIPCRQIVQYKWPIGALTRIGWRPSQWVFSRRGLSNSTVLVPTMMAIFSARILWTKAFVFSVEIASAPFRCPLSIVHCLLSDDRLRSTKPSAVCAHFRIT